VGFHSRFTLHFPNSYWCCPQHWLLLWSNVHSHLFASFLVVLFCFPAVRASNSWIQVSYQLCILEISSCSSCSWQYISEWDIYILMKFCFFTFSLCSLVTFVLFVWNLCLAQGSKGFLLYFLLGFSHIKFKFVILLSRCFMYGVRFFSCLCLTVCPVSASGVKKTPCLQCVMLAHLSKSNWPTYASGHISEFSSTHSFSVSVIMSKRHGPDYSSLTWVLEWDSVSPPPLLFFFNFFLN